MGPCIPVDAAIPLGHHRYRHPGLPGALPEYPGYRHDIRSVTTGLSERTLCHRKKQRPDGRVRKRTALVRAGNRRKSQQGEEGNHNGDANHVLG
jgi:hypothetical protein